MKLFEFLQYGKTFSLIQTSIELKLNIYTKSRREKPEMQEKKHFNCCEANHQKGNISENKAGPNLSHNQSTVSTAKRLASLF